MSILNSNIGDILGSFSLESKILEKDLDHSKCDLATIGTIDSSREIINDVDMKKDCISIVRRFFSDGKDLDFAYSGLEGRCNIALDFYNKVQEKMGINAELQFKPLLPGILGGYIEDKRLIVLNFSLLY